MRLLTLVLALVLGCATLTPALDMPAAPADQRWQGALDVHALLAGRLGRWAQRIAGRDPAQARLAVFTSLTGVDPLKDLGLIAIGGTDASPDRIMAIVTGTLDAEKLATFLRSLPEHQASDHRGQTLHSFQLKEAELRPAVTVAGHSLVAGGSLARAEAAMDAYDGVGAPVDPARFPKVEMPDGAAVLLALGAADVGGWQGLPAEAGPARAVQGITVALAEKDGVLLLRGRLVAVDAPSGEKLASIIDGAVSALALDNHTRTDAALSSLVDSVKLVRHGATVELSAELPIDLAERTWDPRLDTALRSAKARK